MSKTGKPMDLSVLAGGGAHVLRYIHHHGLSDWCKIDSAAPDWNSSHMARHSLKDMGLMRESIDLEWSLAPSTTVWESRTQRQRGTFRRAVTAKKRLTTAFSVGQLDAMRPKSWSAGTCRTPTA